MGDSKFVKDTKWHQDWTETPNSLKRLYNAFMFFEAQKRIATYTKDKLFHIYFLLMCHIKKDEKMIIYGV